MTPSFFVKNNRVKRLLLLQFFHSAPVRPPPKMALCAAVFLCRRFLMRHEWTAIPNSSADEDDLHTEPSQTAPASEITSQEVSVGMIALALLIIILDLLSATVALFTGSVLALIGTIGPWILLASCTLELCILVPVCAIRRLRNNRRDVVKLAGSLVTSNVGQSHTDSDSFTTLVSQAEPFDSKPPVTASDGSVATEHGKL